MQSQRFLSLHLFKVKGRNCKNCHWSPNYLLLCGDFAEVLRFTPYTEFIKPGASMELRHCGQDIFQKLWKIFKTLKKSFEPFLTFSKNFWIFLNNSEDLHRFQNFRSFPKVVQDSRKDSEVFENSCRFPSSSESFHKFFQRFRHGIKYM